MTDRRVAIFALGGTIAMVPGGDGVVPGLDAAQLLGAAPQLSTVAKIEAQAFRTVASGELLFADIAELAAAIGDSRRRGFDGAVVIQGTDTLEETAFLLDLLLGPAQPVVVTGALRNPTLAGADGPANLLSAVRVAASEACRDLGVVVVMNDEIHAARFVRKLHAYKVSAFGSPAAGPLGWTIEDRVQVVLRPARPTPVLPWHGAPAPVRVLAVDFAFDVAALDPLLRDPPAGVILASLGSGHVPARAVGPLEELARARPVVLASRIGTGEVMRATYAYPGAEIDLLGRGLIPGGFLDPAKARILLSLLLADGADRARIEDAFSSI